MASLKASWKARQLELENSVRLGEPQNRPARLELEDEYQTRLGELAQQQEAVRQRQKRELETLAEERIFAHADALAASEAVDASLLDERKRVNEWWNSLLNEADARQQQIDKDERQVLNKIDSIEASELDDVGTKIETLEGEMEGTLIETTKKASITADNWQHTPTTGSAAPATASSCMQQGAPTQVSTDELKSVARNNAASTDTSVVAIASEQLQAPAAAHPSFDTDTIAMSTGVDAHSSFGLAHAIDLLNPRPTDGGFAIPTRPSSLPLQSQTESPSTPDYEPLDEAGSPFILAKVDLRSRTVRELSSSPRSIDSDFVEI